MADNTQVLREYLLSLGFRVNTTESRKFDTALLNVGKTAGWVGGALVAVAGAATALVATYAKEMEKLYYSSKRTGATVAQLQQLQFAGKQVGINAEQMASTVESFAHTLRTKPGLLGMLSRFGVKTQNRSTVDQLLDLVEKISGSGLPYSQQADWAEMFGLGEGQYQLLSQNTAEIKKQMALRAEMDKTAGTNADANAKSMTEWGRQVDVVAEKYEVLKGVLATQLLPIFSEITAATGRMLDEFTKFAGDKRGDPLGTRLSSYKAVGKLLTGDFSGAMELFKNGAEESVNSRGPKAPGAAGGSWSDKFQELREKIVGFGHEPGYAAARFGRGGSVSAGSTDSRQGMSPTQIADMFAGLEQQYGLPSGILDALWSQETSRGKNMVSKTGVIGQFQLTGPIRKRFGVTDPYNLSQEAVAAAEYLQELLQQYGGKLPNALAAWNGGTAAGRDLRLGSDETQRFVPSVLGKMQQTNNFVITGSNANDIAGAVGQRIKAANSQLVNDFKGAVQ